MSQRRRLPTFLLVCGLFIFSGAAGLILQVIWARRLALVFGSTVHSAATTAAAFLLGLGIGAYLAGRLARGSLLRLFGLLELGVAAASLTVTWVIPQVTPLAAVLTSSLQDQPAVLGLVRFCLVFLILLVPCVLMGATLPVLTEFFTIQFPAGFGRVLGTLYTVNTLGAALGALATDFILVRYLGVFESALCAVAFDTVVGLSALGLSGSLSQEAPAKSQIGSIPLQARALLVVSGFCGLALEIVWVRMLVFFNGTDIYSFAVVLAAYLIGLVIGSFVISRFLDRVESLHHLIALLLMAVAWASLTTLWGAAWVSPTKDWLVGLGLGDDLARIAVNICLLLLPTVLLGALFPAITKLVYDFGSSAGDTVGRAYLWNTLGAIFGSLGAGFVLLPTFGLQVSLLVIVVLLAIASLVTAVGERGLYAWGAGVATLLLLLVVARIPGELLNRLLYQEDYSKITFQAEDHYGSIALLKTYYPLERTHHHNLSVDGFTMMANSLRSQRYATMLVTIPAVVHPQPEDVLVVCLGLANSVRAATQLKEVKKVDCVELSPTVARAISTLDYTKPVLSSPKLNLRFGDGRNFLLTTDRRYDIITAEPPPPHHAGVVNLYSKEYFELCRSRLKPGGMVAHWLPIAIMSRFESKTVIRAFSEVFPNTYIWSATDYHLCLVGSLEPMAIPRQRIRLRVENNSDFLRSFGLEQPELFEAAFLHGPEALRSYVLDTPALTDNHPFIQYHQGVDSPDPFLMFQPTESPMIGSDDPTWQAAVSSYRQTLSSLWLSLWGSSGDKHFDWLTQAQLARTVHKGDPDNAYFQVMTRSSDGLLEELLEAESTPDNRLQMARLLFIRGWPDKAMALLEELDSQGEVAGPISIALKAVILADQDHQEEALKLWRQLAQGTTGLPGVERFAKQQLVSQSR